MRCANYSTSFLTSLGHLVSFQSIASRHPSRRLQNGGRSLLVRYRKRLQTQYLHSTRATEGQFSFLVGEDEINHTEDAPRLDTYLSQQIRFASRAKASSAQPEAIPLDVVYEDDDVLVINKTAGVVVHPSAGHFTGTLVNALLHHLQLPAVEVALGNAPDMNGNDGKDLDEDEDESQSSLSLLRQSGTKDNPIIRPGIVHRLDKGTTGLLVMAKNDFSHAQLCQQFQARTVERTYVSLVIGSPDLPEGIVDTNIDRSPTDRLRMVALSPGSRRGKTATSTYKVLQVLPGGKAAVVQWKLKTGRTHQIRVHAKYLGHPLVGDETYAGGAAAAISQIGGAAANRRKAVGEIVLALGRPALHAKSLGFRHPQTGLQLQFDSSIPRDLEQTIANLQAVLQ